MRAAQTRVCDPFAMSDMNHVSPVPEGRLSDSRATQVAATIVLLAGGAGRRMGGVDKGLEMFRGRPLVSWVLDRIAGQAAEILISANRNHARYAEFGYPVVSDSLDNFAGPLAGLQAGMAAAHHELVGCVPCDTPFLPENLVVRLTDALLAQHLDVAVARTPDRAHPVICIARKRLHRHLTQFLNAGGRKFDLWYATLATAEVRFDDPPEAFRNLNCPEDLQEDQGRSRE